MQHTTLTSDEELNSLIYETFSVSNKFLKAVWFLAHAVVILTYLLMPICWKRIYREMCQNAVCFMERRCIQWRHRRV